jgi:phosphoribosyl-AMP cyclohydrolase
MGDARFPDAVRWNEAGLAPAIVQDAQSGVVLMLAWVSRASLERTLETGEAVYYSRSRGALWHKGETSGHFQKIREIRLDCDGDALLFKVEQVGGIACHTGRARCFFTRLDADGWVITEGEGAGSLADPAGFRKGD